MENSYKSCKIDFKPQWFSNLWICDHENQPAGSVLGYIIFLYLKCYLPIYYIHAFLEIFHTPGHFFFRCHQNKNDV